jgi:hypothetical protein
VPWHRNVEILNTKKIRAGFLKFGMAHHSFSISSFDIPDDLAIKEISTPFSFKFLAMSIFPSFFPFFIPKLELCPH